jgi:hypothetical protein
MSKISPAEELTKSKTTESTSKFPDYGIRKSQKKGGIHAPHPDGGIFKAEEDTYLIKRDAKKPENDIAEFLTSRVFQKLAPGSGAEIELTKNKKTQEAFLASKYFKNYEDLYQSIGDKKRHEIFESFQSKFSGTNKTKKALAAKNADGTYKYQNYEQPIAISLLCGDFSLHSGNLGVVNGNELVRIDFGAAFRDMNNDIDPFKSISNRMGFEKNYFLRDHPTERIYTAEFAKALKKVAQEDLNKTVEAAFGQIEKSYDNDINRNALKNFGKRLGLDENASLKQIKEKFQEKMQSRQQSLLAFAEKVELEAAIRRGDTGKIKETVEKNVKPFVEKGNIDYLQDQINKSKSILHVINETQPKSPKAKYYNAIITACDSAISELKDKNPSKIVKHNLDKGDFSAALKFIQENGHKNLEVQFDVKKIELLSILAKKDSTKAAELAEKLNIDNFSKNKKDIKTEQGALLELLNVAGTHRGFFNKGNLGTDTKTMQKMQTFLNNPNNFNMLNQIKEALKTKLEKNAVETPDLKTNLEAYFKMQKNKKEVQSR